MMRVVQTASGIYFPFALVRILLVYIDGRCHLGTKQILYQ